MVKTLGIYLCLNTDEFLFKVKPIDLCTIDTITKRKFLLDVSSVFDPLGLVAPVLITAKIMFQRLWLTGIGIDGMMIFLLKSLSLGVSGGKNYLM